MDNASEIELLLKSSDEKLYLSIGDALDDGFAILPKSAKEKIEDAKRWFNAKKEIYAEIICSNDKIKDLHEKGNAKLEIISVIADSIASISTLVPPITIATLLFKEGIHKLCNTRWK